MRSKVSVCWMKINEEIWKVGTQKTVYKHWPSTLYLSSLNSAASIKNLFAKGAESG